MKKLFARTVSILAAGALALSFGATALAASTGDVNRDGKVTAADATLLLKKIASGNIVSSYDVNGDGKVNAKDATAILKMAAAGSGSSGSSSSSNTEAKYEAEVLRLVNVERAKYGLSAFTTTKKLDEAADIRAKEVDKSYSHRRPDGKEFHTVLSEQGISFWSAGENIAQGYSTPAAVVNAWMNSKGHRENILNPKHKKLGVGFYKNSWVQLFTD